MKNSQSENSQSQYCKQKVLRNEVGVGATACGSGCSKKEVVFGLCNKAVPFEGAKLHTGPSFRDKPELIAIVNVIRPVCFVSKELVRSKKG
jgi:hypothetical protein